MLLTFAPLEKTKYKQQKNIILFYRAHNNEKLQGIVCFFDWLV